MPVCVCVCIRASEYVYMHARACVCIGGRGWGSQQPRGICIDRIGRNLILRQHVRCYNYVSYDSTQSIHST